MLELLAFYLITGFYVSFLLLNRAKDEPDFELLSGTEILVGFLLHFLIWPATVALVINERD